MTIFNPTTFNLLGHRGARAERLENSKIGFAHAHALSPKLNGVEFDVQLTADNQLVVVHDEHLQRLANSQRFIYQSTLAELQTIFQSDWGKFYSSQNTDFATSFLGQPILTLIELLPYLQGYEHIELEVKTHQATDYQALARAVLDVLKNPEWQALNITITSFDTAFLVAWQNLTQNLPQLSVKSGLLLQPTTTLTSEIAFFPLKSAQIYAVCNVACELSCSQIGVYFALITPELVQIAERFNLNVTAWTVNDVAVAEKLLGYGVTTIITDFPSEFCKQLK